MLKNFLCTDPIHTTEIIAHLLSKIENRRAIYTFTIISDVGCSLIQRIFIKSTEFLAQKQYIYSRKSRFSNPKWIANKLHTTTIDWFDIWDA